MILVAKTLNFTYKKLFLIGIVNSFISSKQISIKFYKSDLQIRALYSVKKQEKQGNLELIKQKQDDKKVILKDQSNFNSSLKLQQKAKIIQNLLNKYTLFGMKKVSSQNMQAIITDTLTKFIEMIKTTDPDKISQNNSFKIIINTLCFKSFKILLRQINQTHKLQTDSKIKQLVEDDSIVTALLHQLQNKSLLQKSYAIKYIMAFHKQNATNLKKLQQQLSIKQKNRLLQQETNIDSLIYYLRELMKFSQICDPQSKLKVLDEKFLKQALNFIYQNIMRVSPRKLRVVSQLLSKLQADQNIKQLINKPVVINAVEQHLKGMSMLQKRPKFIQDYISFIQIMQFMAKSQVKLNPKIQQITTKIYQAIKSLYSNKKQGANVDPGEQEEMDKQQQNKLLQELQEQDPENNTHKNRQNQQGKHNINNHPKLVMTKVNILLGSMLKLSTIDSQLFEILQIHFFQNLQESYSQNISIYLTQRMKIIKAVMFSLKQNKNAENSKVRLRLIKQQHSRFILKLIQLLQGNNNINLFSILNIIKATQSIPVKSRQVKRKLKSLIQQQRFKDQANKQILALYQIIAQGF